MLVNNAGTAIPKKFEEATLEERDRVININIRGTFIATQAALKHMNDGGRIVSIGSCVGERMMTPGLTAYAATKGAIDTLVKHFASALGERGIRVNAVAPRVVETDMSNFIKTGAGRDFTLGMQALKRLAQPDDIGDVVAILGSNGARWITGDTVRVDGGSKL